MTYYLTAGWAKGYRTYILAGLGALTTVATWSIGDMTTHNAIQSLWGLAMGSTIRAALD